MTSRDCIIEERISEDCSSFFSEDYAHGFMTKKQVVEKYKYNCQNSDSELCLNFLSNVVSHHDEDLAFEKISDYCSSGEKFNKENCRYLIQRTTKPVKKRVLEIPGTGTHK